MSHHVYKAPTPLDAATLPTNQHYSIIIADPSPVAKIITTSMLTSDAVIIWRIQDAHLSGLIKGALSRFEPPTTSFQEPDLPFFKIESFYSTAR